MRKLKNDHDMQLMLGFVLRWGVWLSMGIVAFGGIVYLYRHGSSDIDYSVFKGTPNFTRNLKDIYYGILSFKGRSIIQAGILLLIATPVCRVLLSAFGFVMEKDYLYVVIALTVLSIIAISILGGFGG
jgi:uncharacterized membrane protein